MSGGDGAAIVAATLGEWGEALRDAIRREDRGRLESAMFDVQRRQIIGYECFYEFAPATIRALNEAGVPPAAAAAAMRRPLQRPYFLQIFELIVNPLLARQQRILTGEAEQLADVERFDAEELPALAEYVSALVRAYRDDPEMGPTDGNDRSQAVLGPDGIAACRESLRPATPDDALAAGRLAGAIGLHSVLLHGEHRDGIFDHGPYPGPGGTQLLVREVNDLANTFLPWSTEAVRLSVSGVALVYAVRDLGMRFDLFGGVSTDPVEFSDRVEAIGVLARTAEELTVIDREGLESIAAEAGRAGGALFADVAAWEGAERVLYGAHLYANHLLPFARMSGERGEGLIAAFVERGREIGARLVGAPLPEVAGHATASGEAPLFTPPSAIGWMARP